MKDQYKGVVYILIGAAAGGVYLEVQRHRAEGAAPSSSSAEANTSAAPSTSTRELPSGQNQQSQGNAAPSQAISHKELIRKNNELFQQAPNGQQMATISAEAAKQAITALRKTIRPAALNRENTWAIAHALIAFEPDLKLQDGSPASSAIFAALIPNASGQTPDWIFPKGTQELPSDSHPWLLVDALLQIGTPLSARYPTSTGEVLSLGELVSQHLSAATSPNTEAGWRDTPWLLDAITRIEKPARPQLKAQLQDGALSQLEKDTASLLDYQGSLSGAFAAGSTLQREKREKRAIFGHHCGGMHFMQGILQLYAEQPSVFPRLQTQLLLLVKRALLERQLYQSLMQQTKGNAQAELGLRIQRLKFFGHASETIGLARALEIYKPETELGAELDAALALLATEISEVVSELNQAGSYAELAAIKQRSVQFYTDLVGDTCHAIRGLSRALPALSQATAQPK